MGEAKQLPKRHRDFVARYPKLGDAWESILAAGAAGSLGLPTTVAACSWLLDVVEKRA